MDFQICTLGFLCFQILNFLKYIEFALNQKLKSSYFSIKNTVTVQHSEHTNRWLYLFKTDLVVWLYPDESSHVVSKGFEQWWLELLFPLDPPPIPESLRLAVLWNDLSSRWSKCLATISADLRLEPAWRRSFEFELLLFLEKKIWVLIIWKMSSM